jgi:hypothetical protein
VEELGVGHQGPPDTEARLHRAQLSKARARLPVQNEYRAPAAKQKHRKPTQLAVLLNHPMSAISRKLAPSQPRAITSS